MARNNSIRQIRGIPFLLGAASLFVIVAGLRAAQSLLVPFMFSVFLAIVGLAALGWLKDRGVPTVLAVIAVAGVSVTLIVAIFLLLATSVNEFTAAIPKYQDRFLDLRASIQPWLEARGVEVTKTTVFDAVEPGAVFDMFGRTLRGLVGALSATLLVIVFMIFMLVEAAGFRKKYEAALGDRVSLERFDATAVEVQRYLLIKTVTSAITGGLVCFFATLIGVDFPLLWGLVAFLFNYVPIVGSIIAAVPAVLLALVQLGGGAAAVLALGYVVINCGISYFLEPILMGRQLGLSPLIILMSLIFWGWVWGPAGMLMSVPLTMILKIFLEHSRDFRWVAMLMGTRLPQRE